MHGLNCKTGWILKQLLQKTRCLKMGTTYYTRNSCAIMMQDVGIGVNDIQNYRVAERVREELGYWDATHLKA